MAIRKLRNEEKALIKWMIEGTQESDLITKKLSNLLVEEMNDGGMGSLRVHVDGEDRRLYSRDLGKQADLKDIDGVPVFITIYLDTNNDFYELDVFKADSSPLKQFPTIWP